LITAIQSNFPNTRLQGCFFHFCQAVVLQVGRLGLGNHYANNQELRKKVKMLMAISIFAGESSARGFPNLKCWGREWLPATKISLWNVRGVVVRTNNHLDDWQNRMNKRARKHHLRFYRFLQLIIDE
ncbi:hypothetical protein T4E_3882, partial [Trichinella pseudospiralis]